MPYQRLSTDNLFNTLEPSFESHALQTFRYQLAGNEVYRQWVEGLGIQEDTIKRWEDIPCLPIELFKTHRIQTGQWEPALNFESSRTTGQTPSIHLVRDEALYKRSIERGFESFFGEPDQYHFMALLPSYLERKNASLVYMVKHLMECAGQEPAFYLNEYRQLRQAWEVVEQSRKKPFIIGVTFALLEWAQLDPQQLPDTIVVETGGMKGRGPELVREEVHGILKKAFRLSAVHSEYGMTELLSQAWSTGNGIFNCPPWMNVTARDPYDPLNQLAPGETGVLNIIDLANQDSCPFIATSDVGRVYEDGSFEVLGRLDHSEVRGCNLMAV